jgi:two-component system sensor histidine kinase/response regulator
VDNCEETRNVLSTIVESFGFHPETASSGMAALEILKSDQQKPFDLVLIDFKMPQMHGLETAMTIRTGLKLDVPIVLMVDFVDKSILPDSAQMIVNRFLTKPVMASSIFNMVLEVFGEKTFVEEKPKAYMLEALDGYRKALGGLKVLVAEDNPINQELAIEIFKTIGVETVIAEDGVKALEALSAQSFDAVLMDIQMPHLDGYETTRKIREIEKFKTLPVIAMTASALLSDEKKCLDAGMNAYVAKPIQLKKLFQTIYEQVLPKNGVDLVLPVESTDASQIPLPYPVTSPDISSVSNHGLNMDRAMRDLNIDVEAYLRIAEAFFHQNLHAIEHMKTWAELQNWREIQAMAHNMAGSSGNIGALNLQSAAREVENCCREAGRDPIHWSRIDAFLNKLDQELSITLSAIDDLLKIKKIKKPSNDISHMDLLEKETCLTNLFHALKESNPIKITTSLRYLKKNFDDSLVNKIEAKIMDYEYDEAGQMLLKIALDRGVNLS